ncbi:MAG: glycoside hydrolase family 16 protein [Clostridia bacterium]|nr:glycoside hydrolase family 16 protein [Clostridia bacterium]
MNDSNSVYKLVFSDEFNGSALDSSKWTFTDYMVGDSYLTTMTSSDVAAIVKDPDEEGDRILRLTAKKVGTDKYQTTKSITTGERMTFKYGYLEMRARVPFGAGVWPSLWLKSNTAAGGEELAAKLGYNSSARYHAEVDVFEVFGNNLAVPNLHKWWKTDEQKTAYGDVRVQSGTDKTYDISDGGWHTYGMLWTANEISMFVDGVCYKTYDINKNFGTAKEGMEGFHEPLCIIINNHLLTPGGPVTSSTNGIPDDFTSATYDIDYIRLYQKPDSSEIYFAK